MGGNGTFSKSNTMPESERRWKTVGVIPATDELPEVVIVEMKNHKYIKTPEESHTANRIYAAFYPDGSDVKEISTYEDHKKTYVIHTETHKGISPHYHIWGNGRELPNADRLTEKMEKLLRHVRDYGKKRV